ncbi:MAG: DMT family transporter [Burkholderiaceae bacterium]|nr:DMT family transporter [Burkholderiaceae bacterium]
MPKTAVPRRALVLLAILTLVWGTNWPLFTLAVREVSVWTFRAVSVSAAGLVLLAVARARGQSLVIPRRHWRTIGLATLLYLVVWNIASTYSALLLPTGQSAVLGYTMPLWAALISWAVLGERLNSRLIAALALGGLSVTLLMVPSFATYASAPAGLALGLLAGLGWAIGTLILKRSTVDVPATVLTGWQLLITAVPIAIGAVALGDHQWFMPSWQTIAVITYITLVPMCVGNVCWFAIVSLLPANVAGLSSIMVPMVAMVSGALVHGEPLGPMQLAAMACCAGALSLTLLRPKAPIVVRADT